MDPLYGMTDSISIHALHEESDSHANALTYMSPLFQSTLSMRRATQGRHEELTAAQFQSTLSMRRATSANDLPINFSYDFNPRSP